jgi:uncharacterized protein
VDPNVLVSAAISARGAPRQIVLAWHSGRFEMVVSYDLLYELEAVLMRSWFRRRLVFSDVVEYVMWIRERATFVPDAPPLEGWLVAQFSDPDDAYLMALAKDHRADYLVTGDRGLLRMAGLLASSTLDLPSLAVLSPQDFVRQALPSQN